MLTFTQSQLEAFELARLRQFTTQALAALADLAIKQGQADPRACAFSWLTAALKIAQRHEIKVGPEIVSLALLVADLGADFDLDPGNEVLADLIATDPLGGASAAVDLVAAHLMRPAQ
jgi:hypothetical protein